MIMITIDHRSRKPIYEQIIDAVKEQVITGILKPDEQIASIRQLTAHLGINPNTIQKAYAELERQGIIYNFIGRGTFVTPDIDKIISEKKEDILLQIKAIFENAKSLKIEKENIEVILNDIYSENQNQKGVNN